MAEVQLSVRIADDQKSLVVAVVQGDSPVIPIEMDLDQLTALIQILGEARSRMLEGSSPEPLEGQNVRTVTCPSWYIQVAKIDGSLLAFDHPSFGPVGFAIPKEDIAEIVRILNGHLAFPSPPPDRRN